MAVPALATFEQQRRAGLGSIERAAANIAAYHQAATPLWRGVPVDKCAYDLLAYQEIIAGQRPAFVLETGAWYGGSALYLADMCELVGSGQVISIDLKPPDGIEHPRITWLAGNSTDPAIVAAVYDRVAGQSALVILDSDHSREHVIRELEAYSGLVQPGGWLIVEDTNIGGHPVRPELYPGPYEAVHEWLARNPNWVAVREVEPFVTFCPGGYLRRMA